MRCTGRQRWLGPWPILRIALLAWILSPGAAAQSPDGWPLHGHALGGQRFSPLNAIGGTQLVTVAVGGNAPFGFTQGDMIMAFGLPE